MPRPKAFDESQVLSLVTQCFWRKGYSATSMKDLERETGLAPGSLYNTFGSKDELFLRALDYYIEAVVEKRVSRYLCDDKPLAGLEAYFLDSFRGEPDEAEFGCLLVNTTIELGPHSEIVRCKVANALANAEEGILKALSRAQSLGQLDPNIDSKSRAEQLALLLKGMLVTAKLQRDPQWLHSSMNVVRAHLC